MPAAPPITTWHWVAFIGSVLVFVLLDLFVFHRGNRPVTMKNALFWTSVTVALALGFSALLVPWRGKEEATEFLTGYVIELSLSMDNVFVIALIFAYFKVPTQYQHRVLFFGFIDALIMRGTFIALGTVVVAKFHWVLYLLGLLLLYSGVKMMLSKQEGVEPERNPLIRLARRVFPVAPAFEGPRFFTRLNGRFALTPLAIVLLAVETADLVFAIDSIPAIFSITNKPFIIFTSNMFAILGLRSLYFVLVGALEYFRYLKYGLALVLVFVGLKMLAEKPVHIPASTSLVIVGGIILVSILLSVFRVKHPR
ncbi:MAG TPA: TerC family protein [Verrucomicrobiae bacterium]|nr:TerC family protein [Verrucomicrobiae bacterium]